MVSVSVRSQMFRHCGGEYSPYWCNIFTVNGKVFKCWNNDDENAVHVYFKAQLRK